MNDLSILSIIMQLSDSKNPILAHGRRVARLACVFAQVMGCSGDVSKIIHHASVVHDIGKISLPAEVINKAGPLDDKELTLVRKHAEIGHDLLQAIRYNPDVARVVLQHHERLDGSGYPFGLRGQDIVPEAKIVALADVVESMLSPQVYRPALSMDETIRQIKQNSGLLYDPKAVAAALTVIEDRDFNSGHLFRQEI